MSGPAIGAADRRGGRPAGGRAAQGAPRAGSPLPSRRWRRHAAPQRGGRSGGGLPVAVRASDALPSGKLRSVLPPPAPPPSARPSHAGGADTCQRRTPRLTWPRRLLPPGPRDRYRPRARAAAQRRFPRALCPRRSRQRSARHRLQPALLGSGPAPTVTLPAAPANGARPAEPLTGRGAEEGAAADKSARPRLAPPRGAHLRRHLTAPPGPGVAPGTAAVSAGGAPSG